MAFILPMLATVGTALGASSASAAAVGGLAIGTGVSALGSIQQGAAQGAASRYNAQIARQNAQIAEQQGKAAAEAQAVDARRKIGSAVANYGASGVDGASGSPLDVLADSARTAALDNLNIKYNYALKALGYKNQASLYESNASNSETPGVFGALGAVGRGLGSMIPLFG